VAGICRIPARSLISVRGYSRSIRPWQLISKNAEHKSGGIFVFGKRKALEIKSRMAEKKLRINPPKEQNLKQSGNEGLVMSYIEKLLMRMKTQNEKADEEDWDGEDVKDPQKLSKSLDTNLNAIKKEFEDCCDLVIREFSFGKEGCIKAALIFIDGLTNQPLINDNIVKPLMYDSRFFRSDETSGFSDIEELRDRLISVGDLKTDQTYRELTQACLSGDAVLLVEGFDKALDISAKGWEKRAVTEPVTEMVVRGPREGFIENLRTNTAMIRRKVKSPALKIRPVRIGDRTNTPVNIVYIEGLADPALITEIERRLSNIDTDAILSAGNIEQYIEDSPDSPFQTIRYSEKPDTIAGKLLEGRAAILVDGTPFVLCVPMLFIENFQASEDYAVRTGYATSMRILRVFAFFISLFGPALYIALVTYHQELIPTTLLITMAASSEGLPFPAALETAVMLISFEILKEAGGRRPRPIGQAISIVGALVMGEAAVQAGLVGAPIVIVVALTAVSSFAVTFVSDAVAILKWLLVILAATMGSYGITLGALAIVIHLASLRSFGVDYLAPFAPFQQTDLKDTIIRAPLWAMRTRPRALHPQDLKRQSFEIPFDPTAVHKGGQGGKK